MIHSYDIFKLIISLPIFDVKKNAALPNEQSRKYDLDDQVTFLIRNINGDDRTGIELQEVLLHAVAEDHAVFRHTVLQKSAIMASTSAAGRPQFSVEKA